MKHKARFRGDLWFQAKVAERTKQALLARGAAFARDHGADTDQQLIDYVRACAAALGHAPARGEVLGGGYVAARLGGWQSVIRLAGLPRPGTPPRLEHRAIYRREYQRQVRLFQQERQRKQKPNGAREQENIPEKENGK